VTTRSKATRKIVIWQLGTAYGPFLLHEAKAWCMQELGVRYHEDIATSKDQADLNNIGADTGLFSIDFYNKRCDSYLCKEP